MYLLTPTAVLHHNLILRHMKTQMFTFTETELWMTFGEDKNDNDLTTTEIYTWYTENGMKDPD